MRAVASAGRAVAVRAASASYGTDAPLKKTALHDLHLELGARMVPYAGWSMPVQYSDGVLQSHHHVRTKAGLFDVSHMGQLRLAGANAIDFIEKLVPGNVRILKPGGCRLSCYTNESGGIIDDTVITRMADHLYIVVNAGCYDKDMAHFKKHLGRADEAGLQVGLETLSHHSLLALQGPSAAAVLASLIPNPETLKSFAFMTARSLVVGGHECHVTRCGYTGEDGFEISVLSSGAVDLARKILAHQDVKPAGLGARDSLRLEAGLCLYGNDIDETITPIEAGLSWFVGKRRQTEGGFLGAEVVLKQMKEGVSKMRTGLIVEGAPARNGAKLFTEDGKTQVGVVTSGVPSPTLGKNIAMGYLATALVAPGTKVAVQGRKGFQPAVVTQLPFVQTRYFRAPGDKQ
eukprot:a841956_130.p1 GENE.a841956_130~~a841956_130.p1  ORF type:complete len:423 (+),score=188.23 a841956_130:61-1269(+)